MHIIRECIVCSYSALPFRAQLEASPDRGALPNIASAQPGGLWGGRLHSTGRQAATAVTAAAGIVRHRRRAELWPYLQTADRPVQHTPTRRAGR